MFEEIRLSDMRKLSADKLKAGCSFNITAEGEFVGMLIIPPYPYTKIKIETEVEEAEKVCGKRRAS